MRGPGSTVTWGPSDQHLRPYSAKGGTYEGHDPLYTELSAGRHIWVGRVITAAILPYIIPGMG